MCTMLSCVVRREISRVDCRVASDSVNAEREISPSKLDDVCDFITVN